MMSRRLVIVGNGMVGHRVVAELHRLDALGPGAVGPGSGWGSGPGSGWQITVLGAEPRPAYDRVALSSWFTGSTVADLTLADEDWYRTIGVELVLGADVSGIDLAAKEVSVGTSTYAYDHLILATGSTPFVPPIPGRDLRGCFVYRTIEDLEAIAARASEPGVRVGAVIGGGLLGLEAANALRHLGLETHVLEFAPRLMPLQLCDGGAAALRSRIESLGVHVHLGAGATGVLGDAGDGSVSALELGGEQLHTDLVVFSAGIRPNDALARAAGLQVGERGGIVVDEHCLTSDPDVSAIGECALASGRVWGLVAPGYQMARVVASRLAGTTDGPRFESSDTSTKLKVLGIDLVSFGDAHGTSTDAVHHVVWSDESSAVYRRLVLSSDGSRVVGGVLVGDIDAAAELMSMARGDTPTPADARLLVLPSGAAKPDVAGSALPDAALVCSCNNVAAGTLRGAVAAGADTVQALKSETTAGTGCGGCVPVMKRVLEMELAAAGRQVDTSICEHFPYTRVQLFDIVRVRNVRTFSELLASCGTGAGCEICKPAVASMLASLGNGYILDGEQITLQDTNDRFLANIQKDGTYSVIPRVPGGEISADHLILLGQIARDFGLYVKLTGGQRVDLLGARVDQLPMIWRRLVDAGMESGHAYGKALRTVKSCVGDAWCRYGVQDSTRRAIDLELRYRGLRAPHKIKMAVSGCARECAEAQSKDVGVIATERGWNLWVSGNGGMRPRHADLLAEDLDDETLVRYVDRFLALYITTADRLERTSTWLENRPGGIDELRRVICDDSLGIGAELEALIEGHLRTYECEWKATLERPERLARFQPFVNTTQPDPVLVELSPRRSRTHRELIGAGA